ncbi:unnamed protein product [Penicillium manginii]
MAIPSTQIAAVIPPTGASANSGVNIVNTHPVPTPGDGDLLVKLEFSGVCHTDIHSIRGDTPMLTDVAGHEGVGTVVSECPGNLPAFEPPYQALIPDLKVNWYLEYIVSPALHVTKIPSEIPPELAAPLLCAGIAMYSSIMKTKPRPGDWIAILGAGGGLGHMGVQIAAKKGLNVLAIDKYAPSEKTTLPNPVRTTPLTLCRGAKKRELCLSLGAKYFLDFSEVDIVDEVKNLTSGLGAHGVICTANGARAYEQSLHMLRPLGTLVCVGIPSVPFNLPATPLDMIIKGLTIVGNSAGTASEMEELLDMAMAGDVKAHIQVFDLDEIHDVLERLEKSDIEGRVVLKIP